MSSRSSLTTYQTQLQCLDSSSPVIKANSDHIAGQQLVFEVEGCSGSEDCVRDVAAQMYSKSIILYANQRVFSDKDFETPFKEEAKFYWVPISPDQREENVYQVRQGIV